jgi:HEPN domain-containing protein
MSVAKPMDEDLQYWLRLADSDMVSAEALHKAGQVLHCLFFLQQAVEKTLKALLVKNAAAAPPRIHNLHKLAERATLVLTREQALLLKNLSRFYLETRYPGTGPNLRLRTVLRRQEESLLLRRN